MISLAPSNEAFPSVQTDQGFLIIWLSTFKEFLRIQYILNFYSFDEFCLNPSINKFKKQQVAKTSRGAMDIKQTIGQSVWLLQIWFFWQNRGFNIFFPHKPIFDLFIIILKGGGSFDLAPVA